MSDYPRMLYKFPGVEEIHGARFATLIVNDEAEHEAAYGDGWEDTTTNAKRRAEQPEPVPVLEQAKQEQETAAPDEATQDRDALKAEATELGLEFPKNIPTERLAEMVAEAKQTQG